jgi:dephospho-CoA kinase
VIVVRADESTRVARLVRQRGMTEPEAYARIRAQATDAQRAAAADVVVPNDGTPAELSGLVDALWTDRLLPYEENLRRRRPAWPRRARAVPYDPAWPAQFTRLARRITRATGVDGRRIQHVGSTAVPGLPAKDTVDIQLGVDDLAAADALADALAAAGLPRAEGEWYDSPRPGTGPAPGTAPRPSAQRWPKRLHGSADPGRPVNLHVRVTGSPGWRYALLMRDFLRADAATLAEYVRLRERPPADGHSRADHTDAEDPWFDAVAARMEDWAARAGWTPPERPAAGKRN